MTTAVKTRATSKTKVTVYTKTGCMPCRALKRDLEKYKVDFEEVNLSEDTKAHDFVVHTLNYTGVPVVIFGEVDEDKKYIQDNGKPSLELQWQGYRPEKVTELQKKIDERNTSAHQ